MVELVHHQKVQEAINRWRLELPAVSHSDESGITKEHLRLLVQILTQTLENELERRSIDNPKNLTKSQSS
jgi:hypothetical protein